MSPAENHLLVRQVRSSIGTKPKHRGTLRSLGLGRIGKQNTLPDRPEIRGMIARVPHLITVEELDAAAAKEAKAKAPAKKRSNAKVADPVAAALATDKAAKSATPADDAEAKPAKAAKKTTAKKAAGAAKAKKATAKKAAAKKTAADEAAD